MAWSFKDIIFMFQKELSIKFSPYPSKITEEFHLTNYRFKI